VAALQPKWSREHLPFRFSCELFRICDVQGFLFHVYQDMLLRRVEASLDPTTRHHTATPAHVAAHVICLSNLQTLSVGYVVWWATLGGGERGRCGGGGCACRKVRGAMAWSVSTISFFPSASRPAVVTHKVRLVLVRFCTNTETCTTEAVQHLAPQKDLTSQCSGEMVAGTWVAWTSPASILAGGGIFRG
jgi:hypothetical protein